jgi:hypothetical protein
MIAWTPRDFDIDGYEPGSMRVGPWPDRDGWSDAYAFTSGACYTHWREVSEGWLVSLLFGVFIDAVVRDGIPPEVAHEALLKIDEYRRHIAPDTPGAEQ